MKKILSAIAILILLTCVASVCFANSKLIYTVSIPFLSKSLNINCAVYTCLLFISGIITAQIFAGFKKNSKDLKSYKNQYEKMAISNEEHSDKVKILEEKIKSLEKALSRALEK